MSPILLICGSLLALFLLAHFTPLGDAFVRVFDHMYLGAILHDFGPLTERLSAFGFYGNRRQVLLVDRGGRLILAIRHHVWLAFTGSISYEELDMEMVAKLHGMFHEAEEIGQQYNGPDIEREERIRRLRRILAMGLALAWLAFMGVGIWQAEEPGNFLLGGVFVGLIAGSIAYQFLAGLIAWRVYAGVRR